MKEHVEVKANLALGEKHAHHLSQKIRRVLARADHSGSVKRLHSTMIFRWNHPGVD